MINSKVNKWELSEDRKTLKIYYKAGAPPDRYHLSALYTWKEACTEDQLNKALELDPATSLDMPGQTTTGHAVYTRFGTIFYGVSTGPPSWWFPKLKISRWKLGAGWLRIAVEISWKKG